MITTEIETAAREIFNAMYERFEFDGVLDEATATAAIVQLVERAVWEKSQAIVTRLKLNFLDQEYSLFGPELKLIDQTNEQFFAQLQPTKEVDCPTCGGSGRIESLQQTCIRCGRTGKVPANKGD